LYSVVSLIPCCRHNSAGVAPAACIRRIPMICSSVNRFRLIVRLLERTKPYNEGISGERVTYQPIDIRSTAATWLDDGQGKQPATCGRLEMGSHLTRSQ
jgi:hypothetical protein